MSAPNPDPRLHESLSALLDGELERGEARFLIRRCGNDGALADHFGRWRLAGDSLRRQPLAPMPSGFASRVMDALAGEPAPRRGFAPVLRWAAGAAVAASVALAALLAVQPAPQPAGEPAVAAAGEVATTPIREQDLRPDFARVPAQTVASSAGRAPAPAVITDPRIEAYLVRHHQALSERGRAGLAPYVYVLSPEQPQLRTVSADEGR